jgi:hypothetical protein
MVGKELHYMIRFENTGTASAVNIVVKDMIDMDKFDISSLVPLEWKSSVYVTRISIGNKVEFIFENINFLLMMPIMMAMSYLKSKPNQHW